MAQAKGAVQAGPSALTQNVTAALQKLLAESPASPETLVGALRLLAKWRVQLLMNTEVKRGGHVVRAGPFAGLRYSTASEGSGLARLLGAYEASLHPVFQEIIAGGYDLIFDIGAAEGYYAVGLALKMPRARVLARDSNPKARALCAALAAENGVAERVEVGGEVTPVDFAICTAQKTLVLCDIEGAEAALLDPSVAPGLLAADLLVEVHEVFRPGLLATLSARFAESHHVQVLHRALAPDLLPDWAETLSDLDRLLMLWEWRMGPTPWLWMRRR